MATLAISPWSNRITFIAVLAVGLVACAQGGEEADPRRDTSEQDIVAGKPASSYAEAVLVTLYQGGAPMALCSGTLVAPKVVLTAGHCVHGWDGWSVEAPFANAETATATSGATYDWKAETEIVDPTMHDVGLVFLSTPIELAAYPTLAVDPVAFGSKVENIGRIHGGQPSFSQLFMGRSVAVADGGKYGFPYAYASTEIIESGDSGGPVIVPATHEIVAVNSGAGNGLQILARVDLVAGWIQKEIDLHGGGGGGAAPKKGSGCGSLSFAGQCSGNSVKWCDNGEPKEVSCADAGLTCAYDKTHKYYNCM